MNPKKIMVIPDTQIRPGDNTDFLEAIGKYAVAKKPDIIVQIGDFADMPSLSSYDVGKKSFEGRRYKNDVAATREAMQRLLTPIEEFNTQQRRNGKKQYRPEMHLTLGNHEDRIDRAVNNDAKLEGVLSVKDLGYEEFGWTVHPFLEVVVLEGVAFSHYFVSGVAGRPVSTASACLAKKHMSCIQGHQQGIQIHTGFTGDGRPLTCVIAGSCYEHDEDYMGPQGNKHWRGLLMLHEVSGGSFDLMPVSLNYLKRKYG